MQIKRLDSSNTMPRYFVLFENTEEASLSNDELFNAIESFNYGGSVQSRDHEKAYVQVYID